MKNPKILAMLAIQAPIQGDNALLELAKIRFQENGFGGEIYPGSVEHLNEICRFCPQDLPVIAHLHRGINLLTDAGQNEVFRYASASQGRLNGILLHDHQHFAQDLPHTVTILDAFDSKLRVIKDAPIVFVEYAAGIEPESFAAIFEKLYLPKRITACIDISHMAIYACRRHFRKIHPDIDVCALKPTDPHLEHYLPDIEASMAHALEVVKDIIKRIVRLNRPLHFHLHDGHPLSTLSLFGVSDHLSFLQTIHLPFPYQGRQELSGIFGVSGLEHSVHKALNYLPAEKMSFTVEVHPQPGRIPLGDHAPIFSHWRQLDNAEQMQYWLTTLVQNAHLVQHAITTWSKEQENE